MALRRPLSAVPALGQPAATVATRLQGCQLSYYNNTALRVSDGHLGLFVDRDMRRSYIYSLLIFVFAVAVTVGYFEILDYRRQQDCYTLREPAGYRSDGLVLGYRITYISEACGWSNPLSHALAVTSRRIRGHVRYWWHLLTGTNQ